MAYSPHDRCGYCRHTRAQHNRREPGNPAPSLRCGAGCVCATFIEADGRPDWAHLQDQHATMRAVGAALDQAYPLGYRSDDNEP